MVLAEIAAVHDRSGATYGSPRVQPGLHRRGLHVSRKRVERLMREARLRGASVRWATAKIEHQRSHDCCR